MLTLLDPELVIPPFNTRIDTLRAGGAIFAEQQISGFLRIGLGYTLQNFRADHICKLEKTALLKRGPEEFALFQAEILGRTYSCRCWIKNNGQGMTLIRVQP